MDTFFDILKCYFFSMRPEEAPTIYRQEDDDDGRRQAPNDGHVAQSGPRNEHDGTRNSRASAVGERTRRSKLSLAEAFGYVPEGFYSGQSR